MGRPRRRHRHHDGSSTPGLTRHVLSQRSQAAARAIPRRRESVFGPLDGVLVQRYVASAAPTSRRRHSEQYEWAAATSRPASAPSRLSTLDRDDITDWIDGLAAGGKLSRRSVQICRTVFRARLSEAVDEGLILAVASGSASGSLALSPRR